MFLLPALEGQSLRSLRSRLPSRCSSAGVVAGVGGERFTTLAPAAAPALVVSRRRDWVGRHAQARVLIGRNWEQARNPVWRFKIIKGKRGGVGTTWGSCSIVLPMPSQTGLKGACVLKCTCCAWCVGWCPVVNGRAETWCVIRATTELTK